LRRIHRKAAAVGVCLGAADTNPVVVAAFAVANIGLAGNLKASAAIDAEPNNIHRYAMVGGNG